MLELSLAPVNVFVIAKKLLSYIGAPLCMDKKNIAIEMRQVAFPLPEGLRNALKMMFQIQVVVYCIIL